MNAYEYTILVDDIILDIGEKHSPNEAQLDAYIERQLIPKQYPQATGYTTKQLFCDSCGGDNDVTVYYTNDRREAKCFDCRSSHFRKTRNYGTMKL